MPTFYTVEGVKIQLYFDDHAPPHFHATIAAHEVLVDISTLRVLEGHPPKRKQRQILGWARENQKDLLAIWDQLHENP